MLTLLNISNVALIEELRVEFENGLNLLTGETGSGKSIIVDALGLLMGGRFTSDLLKSGAERGSIEGLFSTAGHAAVARALAVSGISDEAGSDELIIRREISSTGRNRIFVNNQLATISVLRSLQPFLVDIHGQGDQQTLFDPNTHLDLFDSFAGVAPLREDVARTYADWSALQRDLTELKRGEAETLQLIDVLRFQIDELTRAHLEPEEDRNLEEERKRLVNVEKLKTLSAESFSLIYDDADSALTRLKQAARRIAELSTYESSFSTAVDSLESAQAVIEDLALTLRDFTDKLQFSPSRLSEIEERLADLTGIKRKYGGSIESALDHLGSAESRLQNIETAGEREAELATRTAAARQAYIDSASALHDERVRWVKKFERAVVRELAEVAMDRVKFEVNLSAPPTSELSSYEGHGPMGYDVVEFLFSANPGEPPKPLARVASGGEASRLMLVLKTIAGATDFPRTIVFDEIDSGIGGRISEAVGAKLKRLSESNQVLCVTHQPQIARFADSHLLVRKTTSAVHTRVDLERLDRKGRVEELARMLTGADITESARRHARELLRHDA